MKTVSRREEQILIAIWNLKEAAYLLVIKDHLSTIMNAEWTVGAIHKPLMKLEKEGFTLNIKADHMPAFNHDREVLIQVLINLVENSIKFGRSQPEKRITISAQVKDGWASLGVSDTGPGIPRKALKKVFDDFYRVEDKLTRSTGGTGIGLALVKKFMVAMGGRVEAANNTGAGCTITLRMPL